MLSLRKFGSPQSTPSPQLLLSEVGMSTPGLREVKS